MIDLVYEDGSVAMSDITPITSDNKLTVISAADKPYNIYNNKYGKDIQKVFLSKNGVREPNAYLLKAIEYQGYDVSKAKTFKYIHVKEVL